jgi:hypothetical protein
MGPFRFEAAHGLAGTTLGTDAEQVHGDLHIAGPESRRLRH